MCSPVPVCPLALTAACASLALGGAALADEFDPAIMDGCLSGAGDRAALNACVGLGSSLCIEATGDPLSPAATACVADEARWWDGMLAETHAKAQAEIAALDAEMHAESPGAAPLAPTLDAMQAAFLAYREATCGFDTQAAGDADPAAADTCRIEVTAPYVFRLMVQAGTAPAP